jgi:hypothetical protein
MPLVDIEPMSNMSQRGLYELGYWTLALARRGLRSPVSLCAFPSFLRVRASMRMSRCCYMWAKAGMRYQDTFEGGVKTSLIDPPLIHCGASRRGAPGPERHRHRLRLRPDAIFCLGTRPSEA